MVRTYLGSGSPEHFISFETPDRKTIFGFARLRLAPTAGAGIFSELKGAALVRELHVYGTLIMVNKKKQGVEKSKVGTHFILPGRTS